MKSKLSRELRHKQDEINESLIELRVENSKLQKAKIEFGQIKRQYIYEYRSHTIRAKNELDMLESKKKSLLA